MENFRIRFINENKIITVKGGINLLQAQIDADLEPDAPCNGKGMCGKCIVKIRHSGESEWREVRACRTIVRENLELVTLNNAQKAKILLEAQGIFSRRFDPQVQCVQLLISPCKYGESSSDWSRLLIGLEAVTGRRNYKPNLRLASKLGELIRKNSGRLWVTVDGPNILEIDNEKRRAYMAAFDIGTTSIAGFLLCADHDEVVARRGMLNPQCQFGADVIARAEHALSNGAQELADCVRKAVDRMLGELCEQAQMDRERVFAICVVGNTCMHHLFLNVSPASLVRTPYNPAISEGLILRAADYGLRAHPDATLHIPPVIAGFVGADTVACLVAESWECMDKLTLLIDIGTNGEIVLGNRHRMVVCSTAAGPAFEGAKIECGMRGMEGAIDHVYLEDGQVAWHVIGEGEPEGICGSGLIDLVAVLRKEGEIDSCGKLASGSRYQLGGTQVFLTQRDIREVQLAKGAICAGIRLLVSRLRIDLDQIEQVHIAGAFGNYMNPDSACDIGMIPQELKNRISSIGNAAGIGAQMILNNRAAWRTAEMLAMKAEFVELASLPDFQDEFVDALEFPELEGAIDIGK